MISADSLPIDIESAIDRFDGDRDFVMSIIDEFRKDLPVKMKAIHDCLRAREVNSLARLAHNLKGVALNISVGPIAQVALDLEQMVLRDDLADAAARVAQLEQEVVRLEEFLSNKE